MHSIHSLQALTGGCFAVTRLNTMELHGCMRWGKWQRNLSISISSRVLKNPRDLHRPHTKVEDRVSDVNHFRQMPCEVGKGVAVQTR